MHCRSASRAGTVARRNPGGMVVPGRKIPVKDLRRSLACAAGSALPEALLFDCDGVCSAADAAHTPLQQIARQRHICMMLLHHFIGIIVAAATMRGLFRTSALPTITAPNPHSATCCDLHSHFAAGAR